METKENKNVNVKGGRYVGKKWFLKIAYKTIETDVDFADDELVLSQGSGFAKAGKKSTTVINYSNITEVNSKSKMSTPNAIFAIICAILAVCTQVWAILAVSALMLFLGSTAVVAVENSTKYGNNIYEIPTEFRSDADELQEKILTAVNSVKE